MRPLNAMNAATDVLAKCGSRYEAELDKAAKA